MPIKDLPNTNTAPIKTLPNGQIVETSPPSSVDSPKTGQPTNTPSQAFDLGEIVITTNKLRDHVCDFELEMLKNINLSEYTKAIANTIREAVRKLLAALGLTDTSGESTYWINLLKNIARELRDFNKYIVQPIIDFEKYVLAYIVKLREIIAWILSLPAKLAKLLADCLARLKKLIVRFEIAYQLMTTSEIAKKQLLQMLLKNFRVTENLPRIF